MDKVFMLVSFVYIGAFMICAEIADPNVKKTTFRCIGIFGVIAMTAILIASVINPPAHAAFFVAASGTMIVVCALRALGVFETPGTRETSARN